MITFAMPDTATTTPRSKGMKVGDLAKRTGLSVRTLHYYDEIGLLQPSELTASRHRLYGSAEVARLQQIKSLRQLGFSLDEIRACLGFNSGNMASLDDFIRAIEGINMVERSFTPEELREIKERGERLGAEHIRSVEAEWPKLIANVRAEMLAGTDPASERMRPLATRWRELVREFTGGNPAIEQKLRASYIEEPARMDRTGLDPEIFAYVGKAIRALG